MTALAVVADAKVPSPNPKPSTSTATEDRVPLEHSTDVVDVVPELVESGAGPETAVVDLPAATAVEAAVEADATATEGTPPGGEPISSGDGVPPVRDSTPTGAPGPAGTCRQVFPVSSPDSFRSPSRFGLICSLYL